MEHKKSRKIFAMKALPKQNIIEEDDISSVIQERDVLALGDKENICAE